MKFIKTFVKFIFRILPDKLFLKIIFKYKMGYPLNLKNPKTFNEKIQWLKLYDRKPEYTLMADKYEARKFIADRIGKKYLVPLLGVWDKFDDIDFNKLPNKFVLKCNHDCGSVVICTDKSKFDIKNAREKLNKALKKNYYSPLREWIYKDIKPRIIAEEYLTDNITDYKFYCFGTAKFVQVITDRYIDKSNNMYELPNWTFKHINIDTGFKINPNNLLECPKNLEEMINISNALAKNIPYIRIDLYSIENRIYVGELTFYPGGGFIKTEPDMSKVWGDWLKL